jgi:pSer/pThr/pTyr-binding forkhead associated (FHA) protein
MKEIIVGRQGTQPFPITDPRVSRKHLKVTVKDDGKIVVEDLGSSGGTFVNNEKIIKKVVSSNTVVRLGPELNIKIADILQVPVTATPAIAKSNMATNVVPTTTRPKAPAKRQEITAPSTTKSYSIWHLKKIYYDYQNALDEIDYQAKSIMNKRMNSSLYSMGAAVAGGEIGAVIRIAGLVSTLVTTHKAKKFDAQGLKKELLAQFQKDYVCPNPECHRFINITPYSLLAQHPCCPYCKAKWTEEKPEEK